MTVIKRNDIIISIHAQKRADKRANLRGSNLVNLARKAYRYGIGVENSKWEMQEFIKRKFKSEYKANNIRVYGHFVYVFKNNFLLSVIDLPEYLWNDWKKYKELMESWQ
jgi:hypothetical protein